MSLIAMLELAEWSYVSRLVDAEESAGLQGGSDVAGV